MQLQKNNYRAEAKLLCFFFYFSFATIFSLTVYAIGFRNALQDQQEFINYFSCEAFGVNPSSPCVLGVDRRRDQALIIASGTMPFFAPYITLIYIVPVDKLKEKWRIWRNHVTLPDTNAQGGVKSSSMFPYGHH